MVLVTTSLPYSLVEDFDWAVHIHGVPNVKSFDFRMIERTLLASNCFFIFINQRARDNKGGGL